MPWSQSERDEVVKTLAVVCEITGAEFSDPARLMFLAELEPYPAKQVQQALRTCARECKGRLTLGDVIARLEKVDRKLLSDQRAARDAYLTKLRGCALVERIAWNADDPESVRRELESKGYNFGRPQGLQKPVRSLPHWTDHE